MRFHIFHNGVGNKSFNRRYEAAVVPQNKQMNDEHLERLKNEFLRSKSPPLSVMNDKKKLAEWMALNEQRAKEWARKNEPKRFLNPLLRSMNGIKSDVVMRRTRNGNTAIINSSWVGSDRDVTLDATGRVINIKLGGPTRNNATGVYTYGTTPEGLKDFLGAKSLGHVISVLSRAPEGTTYSGLTKLWDVRKNNEKGRQGRLRSRVR